MAHVTLSFDKEHAASFARLPWSKPLLEWTRKDAAFIDVKSGLARHPVRFVRMGRRSFAIKETSKETALREFRAYTRLHEMGLPALLPVGTAIREEGTFAVATGVGVQAERHATGFIVTRLLEYSIPHYHLFRRAFTHESRKRLWDAVVRLFVRLHTRGVYWGDASLSNMMIVFANEPFPEIGVRTVLRAILADAETVEFRQSLSEQMRRADVDAFLESMAWTEADLEASGVLREPFMTAADQRYVSERYADLYALEQEEESFALLTKIDVDALLGPFEMRGQAKALLQHIAEHKWYLSEREQREISLESAAKDWYAEIFKPVLALFAEFSILDEFTDRTASTLYLDIMLHKYYLSEKTGKDVGLALAFESYASRFRARGRTMENLTGFARTLRNLFGPNAV